MSGQSPRHESLSVSAQPLPNGKSGVDYTWQSMSPHEHSVHIYRDDDHFVDLLANFVADGLESEEGVALIATRDHLDAISERLRSRGLDLGTAIADNQCIALDAHETLSQILGTLNGHPWPNIEVIEPLALDLLARLGQRANGHRRPVRIFGEMVAILWRQGHPAATLRLETFWHEFCLRNSCRVFCSYPHSCFSSSAEDSARDIWHICNSHSKVVAG